MMPEVGRTKVGEYADPATYLTEDLHEIVRA